MVSDIANYQFSKIFVFIRSVIGPQSCLDFSEIRKYFNSQLKHTGTFKSVFNRYKAEMRRFE